MMNSNTVVIRQKLGKGTYFECLIILLYLAFSSPFLFSGIYFSNFLIPYFIKLVLLIILLFRSVRYPFKSECILLIVLCTLYAFYHVAVHPNSAGQHIADSQDIFFAIVSYNIIKRANKQLYFVAFLLFISFLIAVLQLLETALFLVKPSLFFYTEVVGYEVFFNNLLGLVSIDNLRPCWFFAEPSYCGAFLMWCVFLFREYPFSQRRFKLIYYLTVISALVSTASFGSIVVLALCLIISLARRILKLDNRIVVLGLATTVVLFMSVFQDYEPTESSIIRTHSLNARQERVEKGKELRESMHFSDMLFGLGVNAGGKDDGIGLSDAYNKMYIENGVLFLFVYLLLVYKLLRKDIVVFSSVILSLMTVIVQIFPLTLITIIIASGAGDNVSRLKQVQR